MTFNLSKGVFRIATEKMSKNAYRIATPSATIMVQGTEFLAIVEDNRTVIDLYAGKIEIQGVNGGNTTAVAIVAGQSVFLGPEGAPPAVGEVSQPMTLR
jgi:ferric-dicitrate binding protein FerR (iron transport regulator)